MMDAISGSWPWWVAGPLIGLMVPILLLAGNRLFGVSSNFRHICAIVVPDRHDFFRYDWKRTGLWNLTFAVGMIAGGWIAVHIIGSPDAMTGIGEAAKADFAKLGLTDLHGLAPREVFSWGALFTVRGLVSVVVGGFLVGFGARWAGGCTSGHAISGLAALELPSLVAVIGFFAGGLVVSWLVLPLLLGGGS
jgi:uncharacterized protein